MVDDHVVHGHGRIVIPKSLRREILQELHSAHPGQDRTLQRARQCVFWPGITNDIVNMTRSCQSCQIHMASHPKEPLQQDHQPKRPGEAVAAHFFTHQGWEYLVISDKYSGWPDVYLFKKSGVSAEETIQAIIQWATVMGVPNRLTTDNGPQFRGQEFQDFCKDRGIHHEPSSPYNHASNGYA